MDTKKLRKREKYGKLCHASFLLFSVRIRIIIPLFNPIYKKINVASCVVRKCTLFEWTGVVNDCKIVK